MRIFFSSLFCLIFAISISNIEKDFIYKPVFKINEVVFSGDFKMTKQELSKLGNQLYGKNIWEIDSSSIKKNLETDIRIENAEIDFDEIGKITIKIKEKSPSYYVNISNQTYSSDDQGNIFSYIHEHKIHDLPIIFVKDESNVVEVIEILSKIEDENLYQMISQVYYEQPLEINFLIGDNSLIRTNREVESSKYLVLRELYNDLSQTQKIEYIDLRFDGYVVKSTGVEANGKR